MTDNIPDLIAEIRVHAHHDEGCIECDRMRRVADALEAEQQRADSVQFALDGFRSVSRRDNAYLIERAERAEAERDRYRAAIREALASDETYGYMHMETLDILERALDESGDE